MDTEHRERLEGFVMELDDLTMWSFLRLEPSEVDPSALRLRDYETGEILADNLRWTGSSWTFDVQE